MSNPLGMTDEEYDAWLKESMTSKPSPRAGSRAFLCQFEEPFESCRGCDQGLSCSAGARMPIGMWDREDNAPAAV